MTISSNADAARTEADTSRYAKILIVLFFLSLFIPGSFYIGVRMTPFRLYLILMAIPMTLRFVNDPSLRITMVDLLVFLAIFWRSLALLVNHQADEIMNAGASFIELFFAYLLGRTFIRSETDYRFFFKCFLIMMLALLPFALIELVTYRRVLRWIFGFVLIQPAEVISGPSIRFGLMRVQGSFDHALLFGTVCSIGFANMFYLYYESFIKRFAYTGFIGAMTVMAISSSSMLALVIQAGAIAYERVFRRFWWKWVVLAVAIGTVLLNFELIFGKSIGEYVATELALNQAGAETRLDQIEYGVKEIYRYPWFGIGLNVAALPFWRSDIFDNFWLHTAVRFGLPALVFIAAAFAVHFVMIAFAKLETQRLLLLRNGYSIALASTVVSLGSLALWGSGLVFVMVYLGAGAWIYSSGAAEPGPRRVGAARRSAATPRRRLDPIPANAGAAGAGGRRRPRDARSGRRRTHAGSG